MLFDHFWLICGIWVGFGSYIMGKVRSKEFIQNGELLEAEANKYLVRFSLWIFVPSVFFWLLQFSAGSGVGVDFLSWPDPQKSVALAILICLWTYLIVWTLFLGGAVPLGKCMRLISNFPKSMLTPIAVKIIVSIVVFSGIASLFMQRV